MRHIQGRDRAQSLLLPASVEDYVGADNPVRAIEAFVDGFDLAKAGFVRAAAKKTGRPGYHPGDLFKLYLSGDLNRVRSSRRGEYAAIQAELERTGESQVSLTDPDSRAMATYPKVGVGYNAQVAVDAKHKLIVEQEVTNLGSDLGQLAPTAIPAKEALGVERIQATADRGSYKGEDIAACAAAGIVAFVPKPLGRGAAASHGRFPKEAFLYDAAADVSRRPASETLSPHGESTTRGHRLLLSYHPTACRRCPLKAQCTSNSRGRRIARWEGEAVLDAMAARLAANPQMTRQRRNTVEHPFGTIKHAMNQGHFLLKGLRQVRAEFSLSTLADNLLRVINIVGAQKLVEARRRRFRALARAIRRAHDHGGGFLRPRVRPDRPPRENLRRGWSARLNEPPHPRFHTTSKVFRGRPRREEGTRARLHARRKIGNGNV